MNEAAATSTRPYLIRALYEWCTDNGFTPYVAVSVDSTVQVPREYVKNNEIVLNIGFDATSSLTLGNEFIEFKARFSGSAREILVPISHVIAIYARENGQGMAFPLESGEKGPASFGVGRIPVQRDPGLKTAALPDSSLDASDAKIMQLVEVLPDSQISDTGDADKPDPPQPSKPPSRPRPSLKRVK